MKNIQSNDQYKMMVENTLVGIYTICENKFTYVNEYFTNETGYSAEELFSMSPLDLVHEDDVDYVMSKIQKRLENISEPLEYSFKAVTKTGEIRYARVYGKTIYVDGVKTIIGSLVDETEKTIARQKLEYLANYDSLTGLYNRYYFNMQFEHIIKQSRRHNNKLALIFFDIDNFKRINDSLGHKTGDIVLIKTAKIIQAILRDSDSFYRLGGDEFIVLMENFHANDEIRILIKRIQEALKTSIKVDELSFHISISIGVSVFPDHGNDIDSLQKSADIAMYKSKKEGKNRCTLFEKNTHHTEKILELENELYDGMEDGEMELFLQPQILLKDKSLCGAEALVRWRHPKRGLLAPNAFLPLAQEMGLLYKLDLFMIEKTFLLLEKYHLLDILNFTISVNISHALFHHQRFFSIMQKFQDRFPMLCKFVQLELTEEIIMVDQNHALKIIKSLSLLGYKLAIDDFGTGYSSFSQLKLMNIDELKIDRAFIKDIDNGSKDRAITEAIVNLGQTLGLKIVAEGAETQKAVDILMQMNCDIVQGYYYDKPLEVKGFEQKWLQL